MNTITASIVNLDALDLFLPLLVLFSVVLHEYAHAWTAYKMGDPTAKAEGRLTLNPIAHLDVLGTLMMLLAHIGWAKPVPVNFRVIERNSGRSGVFATILAGPLVNILMAVLSVVILKGANITGSILTSIFVLGIVNLNLALFNLLPLYPLDGGKILELWFGDKWPELFSVLRKLGPVLIIALVFSSFWETITSKVLLYYIQLIV